MQPFLGINLNKKTEKLQCFYSRGSSQISDGLGDPVMRAKDMSILKGHLTYEGKDSLSFDCSEQTAHTQGEADFGII